MTPGMPADEPVQFFCLARGICLSAEDILDDEHRKHIDHIKTVKRAFPHVRHQVEQLAQQYTAWGDELRGTERQLQDQIQQLIQAADMAKAEQARVFATLRDSLRIREEQLAADSDDAAARFKAALDTELSTVIAEQAQVSDQVETMKNLLRVNDTVGTLKWYSDSRHMINSLAQRHNARPQVGEVDAGSLRALEKDVRELSDRVSRMIGIQWRAR
jgi:predicted component of type VI protein secretion system